MAMRGLVLDLVRIHFGIEMVDRFCNRASHKRSVWIDGL